MREKNLIAVIVSGSLAIIGGGLILNSGFRTQGLFVSVLNYSEQHFASFLPADLQGLVKVGILILSIVIGLGGIVVILGGFFVLLEHLTTGRLLIALGGGVGFVGIVIGLMVFVYSSGIEAIFAHLEYWVGLVVASLSRYLMKKA